MRIRRPTRGTCRSAGRVQSVAVRLICEREEEVDGFNAQEFFMALAEGKVSPDAIPVPQTRRTRDRIGKEN